MKGRGWGAVENEGQRSAFEELGGGDAVAVHRGAVPFDVVDPSPPWDVPLRADAEAALVDSNPNRMAMADRSKAEVGRNRKLI